MTVQVPVAAVPGIVTVRVQMPSTVVPDARSIPPVTVWPVESELTTTVGGWVPVWSVSRADTVTCLAPL